MIFVHFLKKKKIFILKAASKKFYSLYNILAQLWGMFSPEKVLWTLFNSSLKYFLKGEKENQSRAEILHKEKHTDTAHGEKNVQIDIFCS